jgi:outer membrane protein assembly factor BamB
MPIEFRYSDDLRDSAGCPGHGSSPALLSAALLLLLALSAVGATEVTISLVTLKDGKRVPLSEFHELRRSPYGGWVASFWPFGMKVGENPILDFEEKLLKQALADHETAEGTKATAMDEVEDIPELRDGPAVVPGISRSSTAKVSLPDGDHLIQPGDLKFHLEQGKLSSDDPRVRIADEGETVEVLCWPIAVRGYNGVRSAPFHAVLSYGPLDMTVGLFKPLENPDRSKLVQEEQTQGPRRYQKIQVYLPPSPDRPFGLNGVAVRISQSGEVSAGKSDYVSAAAKSVLQVNVAPPPPVRPVGIRWLSCGSDYGVSTGATAMAATNLATSNPTGACLAMVPVPNSAKTFVLRFTRAKETYGTEIQVPNTFEEWPHKTVFFDAAPRAARAYLFETGALAVQPGETYRCRLRPVAGEDKALAKSISWTLSPTSGPANPVAFPLEPREEGDFVGKVPDGLPRGLYALTANGDHALSGQRLGLLIVSGQKVESTVSVYAYRNRAGIRRGDPVDLFWTVRAAKGAPAIGRIEFVLRSAYLEKVIAADEPPAAPASTGHLRLPTDALAPGRYEVTVRPDSVICYPALLHVYQREPGTDYEIYSQAPFSEQEFCAGTPITAYYAQGTGGGTPGLAPLSDEAYGNLDAAFGMYAVSPVGPAAEKCALPDADEVGLMALARLGKRAVPSMPVMLHHEEWNPKHTLPEELRRLRRRNALFTQKYADLGAFAGLRLNWYATLGGYWEESEPLDGHQGLRNAESGKWVAQNVAKKVEEEKKKNPDPEHLKIIQQQAGYEYGSLILPHAYEHYLADANVIRPGLTSHSGIPDFWLGGGGSYAPLAYSTLSHRDAVDYTDYGRTPWGEFRAPAFLGMDNPKGQKTQVGFAGYGRHARFITSFAAAGRGLDGYAINPSADTMTTDHEAMLRIFERFGSYFTALDPLPDVAVYFSKSSAWAHQKSVILHDLARLRRPGTLISQEEVLQGGLDKHKVLFLAAIGDLELPAVREAFRKFAEKGGIILKDRTCSQWVPGKDIGFAYDGDQVPGRAWGLGGPDGEWEFAFLWGKFLSDREPHLLKAFEGVPPLPVGTSDKEVLISPLADKESICCFVTNLTYIPMSVGGKQRQHATLPRKADLIVQDGWFVFDLLERKQVGPEKRDGANRVAMDFSRAEGKLFLLTKRLPQGMGFKAQRILGLSPVLRLTAWLTDAGKEPMGDLAPFEVTLTGPTGEILFHKFAAVSPQRALDVPLPAMSEGTSLTLTVKDEVLGAWATQEVRPAPVETVAAEAAVDVVGLPQIRQFLGARGNRVIVLLDEGQEQYQKAAEQVVQLLKQRGREAKLMVVDPTEVRELPLRWKPLDEDKKLLERVHAGEAVAWRVDLAPWSKAKENPFDRPTVGYPEYGPRTMIDGDVVLFGGPDDNRCLEDLDEFLRRRPSANYPSPGRFFLHYVWDAFLGANDALYVGCRDAVGAEAAVQHLSGLKPVSEVAQPETKAEEPLAASAKDRQPLESLLQGKIGTPIADFGWSPTGNRIFVTADSYGDSFFVLDKDGNVLEKRPIGNRLGNSVFWQGSGALRPLSDTEVYITLWNTEYLLDIGKGFVSQATKPGHGLPGRIKIRPIGDVLLRDLAHGRSYLAGFQQIYALDKTGRMLWKYDDVPVRTGTQDMLYRRSIFIRGLSPNGKRLVASAFGVEEDVYSLGTMRNNSVFCIDTDTGKVLWDKDGLILNEGKAIVADDRVIIVADDGKFHLFQADTGSPAGQFRPVGGTDYMLPVPGSEYLLIVENNQFDRLGPSCKAYLRAPGDQPDVVLGFGGRVTDVKLTPDNQAIVLASVRGETACFGLDGKERWRAQTPTGGMVHFPPDGQVTGVGSQEGTLHFFKTADGAPVRKLDFNPYNLTSGQQYLEQMKTIGDVPAEQTVKAPVEPPEPSYLESLDKRAITFGENLLPPDVLLGSLKKAEMPAGDPAKPQSLALLDRPVVFALKVKPRSTYLVEFLNAAQDPAKLTAQTRIEVSVSAEGTSKHLPFTGRLPVGQRLTRRRMGFRTEKETAVTMRLRAVVPSQKGEGGRAYQTYDPGTDSPVPMQLGDVVVAPMKFQSRNILYNPSQGDLTKRKGPPAKGEIKCSVTPWRGGVSYLRWRPWDAPQSALRVADGLLGNQETKWQETGDVNTGSGVHSADAFVKFKKAEPLNAIVIYEDNRGPVPSGGSIQEMTTMHYGVYAHEAAENAWRRVGYVAGNTNLVSIFTFPAVDADQLHYFWAGRPLCHLTDGMVRMAEFEAYSTEAGEFDLEEGPEEGDGEIELDVEK